MSSTPPLTQDDHCRIILTVLAATTAELRGIKRATSDAMDRRNEAICDAFVEGVKMRQIAEAAGISPEQVYNITAKVRPPRDEWYYPRSAPAPRAPEQSPDSAS